MAEYTEYHLLENMIELDSQDVQDEPEEMVIPEPDKDQQTCCKKIWHSITVEPVLFLYFLSFTPGLTTIHQFVYHHISEEYNYTHQENNSTCVQNTNSSEYHKQQRVQSDSATWMIYYHVLQIIPCLISSVIIGSYGDKKGRKLGVLLAVVGIIMQFGVAILVIVFKLPLQVLLLGSFLDGLTGSETLLLSNCFSSVADIVNVEGRAFRFAILEMTLSLAGFFGSLVIGYIIKHVSFLWAFITLIGINAIGILYIIFVLKETVVENDNEHSPILTLKHFTKAFKPFFKDNGSKRRWKLQMLVVIMCLWELCKHGSDDIQTYTLLNVPFCFSSVYIGYFVGTLHLSRGIGTLFVKPFRLCLKEAEIMLISSTGCFCGFLIFGLAENWEVVFLVPMAMLFTQMVLAMIRSYVSRLVDSEEIGAVFAGLNWIKTTSILLGSVLINTIYSAVVSHHLRPGTTFFILCGILTVEIIFNVILVVRGRIEEKSKKDNYSHLH